MLRSLCLLIALALSGPASAQSGRWATAEDNLYWPLKEARARAYSDHDRAFFEGLLADTFVGMGPDGRLSSRADYLAAEFGAERPPGMAPVTEVDDFHAVRTGATLVMHYTETVRTAVGADAFVEHLRRLDVYVWAGGRWRLQAMTAARIPQAPATMPIDPAKLADYEGAYVFGPGIISTVRRDGGRLLEQTSGQPEGELLPVAPDTFYAPPDVEARVVFERDGAGRVVAQVYQSSGQRLRALRR